MANPLTLYIPIKQDGPTQAAAKAAAAAFVTLVQKGLDDSQLVHYARLALIPNVSGKGILGIILITTFDHGMNPYLDFFWKQEGTREAFQGVAKLALNPPKQPVTTPTGFENFINANNLPCELYQAYKLTVQQINGPKKPAPAKKPTKAPPKKSTK